MLATLLVLIHSLAVLSLPAPAVIDVEHNKDITQINKDLNLYEGDIVRSRTRSTLLSESSRWNIRVPYLLDESLDPQTAALTLYAFEQFALKSCISFTPYQNEQYFLNIEKQTGCWSLVGKTYEGGQPVSLGEGCAVIGTVEHELLHALGFYHEQSRYDRDNYVTIIPENILEGKESNFDKVSNKTTSLLNTAYDYTSIMHYPGTAFSNGNGSTIITKQPEFQDVIGRRGEMSSTDALELNRLYKCQSSAAFYGNCSFEDEAMCGMEVCSRGSSGWERVNYAEGGPRMDHTHLSTPTEGEGFFMHFSTMLGEEGDSGKLSTKVMTPSRSCPVQCVQFYYYYSGNETDILNVWIREFDDYFDTNGHRRLMGQITGSPADYWRIHHVPLNATKRFVVEFEAVKGAGPSNGGFSLDDINLSQTECPHYSWQIRNFEKALNNSNETYLFSPRYYTSDGYSYQVYLVLRESFVSLFFRLVSGDYDSQLEWPFGWRYFSARMMDQNPNMQQRMNELYSHTIDPRRMLDNETSFWGNPREVGTLVEDDGESYYASLGYGVFYFTDLDKLKKGNFLKGGDAIFLFSMQDVRPLFTSNSLPCAKLPPQSFSVPDESFDDGPCSTISFTTPPSTTTEDPYCNSILCSFSHKMDVSLPLLLISLLLLFNR